MSSVLKFKDWIRQVYSKYLRVSEDSYLWSITVKVVDASVCRLVFSREELAERRFEEEGEGLKLFIQVFDGRKPFKSVCVN